MNIPENIPIDLINLLIFTMPGFFFVRAFSKKVRTDFEYLMLSMFWGILIMILFYNILPGTRFIPLLDNPYAGALIFSILSYMLGFLIKFAKNLSQRITNGTLRNNPE